MKEKIKNSFQRVKTHLVENKETYIVGVGSFVIGVGISYAVGEYVRVNTPAQSGGSINAGDVSSAPVAEVDVDGDVLGNIAIDQSVSVANTVINNFGGHLCKIVRCVETGEIFETAKAAAESAGVTPSNMSRHLSGKTSNLFGKSYEVIGIGTT